MSAAPTTDKVPKFPFEMQISGLIFTCSICFISIFMVLKFASVSFLLGIRALVDLVYWSLFFYFAIMVIAFPDYLADEKPNIARLWPIATASFLRLFWILESDEISSKSILMVLLGRALILVFFYFCYFVGKDVWPLGNIFKPWIRINYESVEKNDQV